MSDGPIGSDDVTPEPVAGELHTRSQWSMRVEALVAELSSTKPTDVVTYERLVELTSVRDRNELHSLVASARRQVREEPGFVFRAIDNVGYVHLTDAEIAVRTPAEARAQMRRRAVRARQELECVKDFNALTPDQRAQWNAGRVISSVVEHALHATRVQKVLKSVDAGTQLREANAFLIEMITGKKNKPNDGQKT